MLSKIFQKRKYRLLIAFISLFLLVSMIQDSYAKYISSATATSDLTIAKWAFKVNNQDVLAAADFSTVLSPVFTGNTYTAENVIAPTAQGYFDLTVDASNVDVAYTQTITITRSDTNTVTDLDITGYKLNGGTMVAFTDTTAPSFSTDHALHETPSTNTYRIYVNWLDGTGETMDNTADTTASQTGIASFKVTINFVQKAA